MAATESTRMRRWSRWMSAWTALSVPGLCLVAIAWGPGTMLALAAVVPGPLALTLILLTFDQKQGQAHSLRAGWITRVLLCAVSVFISTVGIVSFIPGLALLVVLVVIVTAPPMVDLRRRVLGHVDSAHAPPPPAGVTTREHPPPRQASGDVAGAMTDGQLCQAWRSSYWALKDARDPIEKLRLVEQRTRLLDELEARNAAALGAWLASGARACDGPEKFFDTDERDQPTAA